MASARRPPPAARRPPAASPQVLSLSMCVGAAVPMRLRPLPASLFKEPNRLLPPVAPAPGLLAFPLYPPLREALERTHCSMNTASASASASGASVVSRTDAT